MVTRDIAWPKGVPCWIDLGVADLDRAKEFYSNLFGWQIEIGPPESGDYSMCLSHGRSVAGLGPNQGPADTPPLWMVYLATDDVDATTRDVTQAGGTLVVEPMDVMDAGRMAVAIDTGGAAFGLWQAGAHIGTGLSSEPVSMVWNENWSRDFAGNQAFYRAIFGYEYEDMSTPNMTYATVKINDEYVGGIAELDATASPNTAGSPNTAAYWSVYFAVEDTDAILDKVTELGGSVSRPAMDTPHGRMAEVRDYGGATFSVVSPPGA